MIYDPLDATPYAQHSGSQPIRPGIASGNYVYVMDLNGVIHVLPDEPHRHPRILGAAQSVKYAGDLMIKECTIIDVTNLSGTFDCDDAAGLLDVADELRRQGFLVSSRGVRFFPRDGSRPRILQ